MKIDTFEGTGDKKLLLISGLHGDEYNPVVALRELFIDAKSDFVTDLKSRYSSITVLHAVNRQGLVNNTRLCEGIDLNRIEDYSSDKLKQFIDDSDVIVDVHASPKCSTFVLISNNDEASSYVKFCKDFHLNYVVWSDSAANSTKAYAISKGKTAFTIECSGIGSVDELSVFLVKSMIKTISLNAGNYSFDKEIQKATPSFNVVAPSAGILQWLSTTECRIINPATLESTDVSLPDSGIPLVWSPSGYVKENDFLALIQPL